jgi:PII-like signaling protein
LVTVAVDDRPRIEAALDEALTISSPGLVTLQRLLLLDDAAKPSTVPPSLESETVRMTIYLGRQSRAHQILAFEAICDLLYRRCISGASCCLCHHRRTDS